MSNEQGLLTLNIQEPADGWDIVAGAAPVGVNRNGLAPDRLEPNSIGVQRVAVSSWDHSSTMGSVPVAWGQVEEETGR